METQTKHVKPCNASCNLHYQTNSTCDFTILMIRQTYTEGLIRQIYNGLPCFWQALFYNSKVDLQIAYAKILWFSFVPLWIFNDFNCVNIETLTTVNRVCVSGDVAQRVGRRNVRNCRDNAIFKWRKNLRRWENCHDRESMLYITVFWPPVCSSNANSMHLPHGSFLNS